MTEIEELEQLRREKRIRELEALEGTGPATAFELPTTTQAKQYAGKYLPKSGNVKDMDSGLRADLAIKSAWDRGAYGLKKLFTDLSPEEKEQLEQGRAFTSEAGWPGFVGETAVDGGVSAAMSGPASLIKGATLLPAAARAVTGMAGDTAAGALMSPENRKTGAVGGLVGSVLGHTTGGLAGGALSSFIRPEARAMIESSEGRIMPTVGQAMGGWPNKWEQKATSIPIVGDAAAHARNRTVDQWSAEMLHRVLPPQWRMGLPNRGLGDEAMFAVRDRISDMYNDALSRFPQRFAVDAEQLAAAGEQAARRGDLGLNEQGQAQVRLWVQQNLLDRAQNMTPQVAKGIESDLNAYIRSLRSGNATHQDRAIASALGDVQQAWRGSLTGIGDAGGEGAGQALRQADASYRAFLPLDTAAAKRVSQNAEPPGRFSPRTARQGFEQVDQSKNNTQSRRVAAGVDPYQPPPARPGPAAAAVEPDPFTRGPQTPMSSSTDLAVQPSPFGFSGGNPQIGGQARLPGPGGGQLGPVRSGEVGAAVPPGAAPGARRRGAPFRPEEGAPAAPGGIYEPYDDINRLTRQGEMVIPDRVPDSGTTARSLFAAIPAAAGSAYYFGGVPAVTAAAGLGVGGVVGSMDWAQRMLLQGNRGAQALNDYLLGPALTGAGIGAGVKAGAPESADERRAAELKRQLRRTQ